MEGVLQGRGKMAADEYIPSGFVEEWKTLMDNRILRRQFDVAAQYRRRHPPGAIRFRHRQLAAREEIGLSLADLTERTGMDRSAFSKLETEQRPNSTVETLVRYAKAAGK